MKMNVRALAVLSSVVALVCAAPAWSAPGDAALSDAVTVRRPIGGEWFGLYLMDKKVGWMFSDFTFVPNSKDKVQSIQELYFKVEVSSKVSERQQREVRVYEAKPHGRLLSMKLEQKGDGGAQTLDVTATPAGLTVVRKRPGMATEVKTAPPSKETVEDADQARVAIFRNKDVAGFLTDAEDLATYKLDTKLLKPVERVINGVKVKLRATTTISEKEKVPVTLYLGESGEVVEVDFGGQMRAVAESEAMAKRQDKVELFGLTRVVLPQTPPPAAQQVGGALTLIMNGLPEQFWHSSYRQKFKSLGDDKVEVTLMSVAPKLEKKLVRPLWDPNGGKNLKSTLVVEANDPKIRATAKKILGGEKDAYTSARKIVAWVGANMEKDYGASADRATDVLRQMKGDCTEHSLLAVALLRAAGIPAKRVDGLVYLKNEDGVPALYWHEWVEAWVGEWTQLDPTFGQDVADATHFAVGEEGNAEIIPLIGRMKVLEVR